MPGSFSSNATANKRSCEESKNGEQKGKDNWETYLQDRI